MKESKMIDAVFAAGLMLAYIACIEMISIGSLYIVRAVLT